MRFNCLREQIVTSLTTASDGGMPTRGENGNHIAGGKWGRGC